MTPLAHLIAILKRDVNALQTDPKAQYDYHKYASVVWLALMVVLPFAPVLYNAQIALLILAEVSFYANFATEFGSMGAAEAAIGSMARNTPETAVVTPDALPGTITKPQYYRPKRRQVVDEFKH